MGAAFRRLRGAGPESTADTISANAIAQRIRTVEQDDVERVLRKVLVEFDTWMHRGHWKSTSSFLAYENLFEKPSVLAAVRERLREEGLSMHESLPSYGGRCWNVCPYVDVGLAAQYFSAKRKLEADEISTFNAELLTKLQRVLLRWQHSASATEWAALGVSQDGTILKLACPVKVNPETWSTVNEFLTSRGFSGTLQPYSTYSNRDVIVVKLGQAAASQ